MIRPARPDELPLLAEIEDTAAQAFRGTAMAFVLGLPNRPVQPQVAISDPVFIWASVDPDDRPVGFLEAEIVGEWLHVFELSVHPDWQQQGRARALLDTASHFARSRSLRCVSLTTDRDIAWNGPAYRRMGFVQLAAAETPPWLAEILANELALGFDPARRIAMARTA